MSSTAVYIDATSVRAVQTDNAHCIAYNVNKYPGQHLFPLIPDKAAGQSHMGGHCMRDMPSGAPIHICLWKSDHKL